MGQVRKIGDEYYIEFYARGLLYQQKAGKDENCARQMLVEVEGKIIQGEMGTITRDVDIDVFLKTFLDYAKSEYSKKTFNRYQSLAKHFVQFLKQENLKLFKLSEVTPRVIESYRIFLIQTPLKPGLINFTLHLLRDTLDYSIKLGYLNDNPTLHVRFIPVVARTQFKNFAIKDVEKIKQVLTQGISLGKLHRLLGFQDIAKTFCYSQRCPVFTKNINRTSLE